MKYLKYFESQNGVSLRQKLEIIVDMSDYLWSIGATESFGGFYGKCSSLFTGCLDMNKGWSRSGKKPYNFNIDCLINELEKSDYRKKEKLQIVEDLYYLSITTKKAKHTKSEIKELLKPVLEYEILGGKIIDSLEIDQFYNWQKQPIFSIEFHINEEELSCDKNEIDQLYKEFDHYDSIDAKKKLKEIKKEFFRIKNLIKIQLKKIDFKSHNLEIECFSDSSNLGNLNTFILQLKEI
jgi:hypothetical protein